jgi:peptide/nickel transport system permease protein
MLHFFARKLAYGFAILIGINLLTFVLFFKVNTPEDMARMQLGGKRVTPDAIEKWKAERGYDRPLFFNEQEKGFAQLSQTLFVDSSLRMFAFDFGRADSGRVFQLCWHLDWHFSDSLTLTFGEQSFA